MDFSGISVITVGMLGPAGGIVFYDKGNVSDGWRFLEAAPAETEFTAQWGGQNVTGTSTAVGSGKRNTQLIVEQLKTLGESGKAAQVCANLNIGGFNDCFLPSKDELNLMYRNLKQKGLGNFGIGYYWCSSQSSNSNTCDQRFSDGYQNYGRNGGNAYSVRAVRAF